MQGVTVSVLHGKPRDISTVKEAIEFIQKYDDSTASHPVLKYEIHIRYNNGDTIHAIFDSKTESVKFLHSFT